MKEYLIEHWACIVPLFAMTLYFIYVSERRLIRYIELKKKYEAMDQTFTDVMNAIDADDFPNNFIRKNGKRTLSK